MMILQMENRDDPFLNKLMNKNKDTALQNNFRYIRKQTSQELVPPYWGKVFETHELLKSNSYVFWLDSDAILVNPKKLIQILENDQKHSMWISRDMPPWETGEFNAGSFIIKNDTMGNLILDEWKKLYNSKKWNYDGENWRTDSVWAGDDYEQGSFVKFILPKFRENISQMPYFVFNHNSCSNLSEDVVSIHLAGNYKQIERENCESFLKTEETSWAFPVIIFSILFLFLFSSLLWMFIK